MDDSLAQDEIDALLNAMSSEETPALSNADEAPQPFLSQNEIDSLLNVVAPQPSQTAGGAATALGPNAGKMKGKDGSVEKYDFTLPSRVSRDHIRSLRTLHNSYAQSLGSSFSILLRTVVEVTCIQIEQLSYGEYLASLLDPSCLGVFIMNPLKGHGVIELNPMLVFPIIDRLLGGSGTSRFYNRSFTAIEEMVVRQVMENALSRLQSAWQRNIKLEIELERLENNPQFIQAAAMNDPVILIMFDVMMGDVHSMMSLCFPFLTIQQALASLRHEEYTTSIDAETAALCEDMMQAHMLNLDIPVSARYKTSRVTLSELMEMQEGDIIKLPDTSKDEVQIFVDGKMKYLGKPGMANNRRAVQINVVGTGSQTGGTS